jgi:hypothetical protein
VAGLLLYIKRKTGLAHVDRSCEAIVSMPALKLRLALFDPNRPRRRCSRCWAAGRPHSRAFAAGSASVTERSEGNPQGALTDGGPTATPGRTRLAARGWTGGGGGRALDRQAKPRIGWSSIPFGATPVRRA